jgi:hypothetical protein
MANVGGAFLGNDSKGGSYSHTAPENIIVYQ